MFNINWEREIIFYYLLWNIFITITYSFFHYIETVLFLLYININIKLYAIFFRKRDIVDKYKIEEDATLTRKIQLFCRNVISPISVKYLPNVLSFTSCKMLFAILVHFALFLQIFPLSEILGTPNHVPWVKSWLHAPPPL